MIEARFSPPMTAMLLAYGLMLYYLVTGQFFSVASASIHQLYVYLVLAYGIVFHFVYGPSPVGRPEVEEVGVTSTTIAN